MSNPGSRRARINHRLIGTPWHDADARIAPGPEDLPTLVTEVAGVTLSQSDWPDDAIVSITAPTPIVGSDSDILRPEHAVEQFRPHDGGVNGDMTGLPGSQLAVLPGTSHSTMVERAELLAPMVTAFLDSPMPESSGTKSTRCAVAALRYPFRAVVTPSRQDAMARFDGVDAPISVDYSTVSSSCMPISRWAPSPRGQITV